MNDIINILGLEDESVQITNIAICDMVKTITIEKLLSPSYCPVCGGRMHSKGVSVRKINHPILQGCGHLQQIFYGDIKFSFWAANRHIT